MKKILCTLLILVLCFSCAAFADTTSDETIYARVKVPYGTPTSAVYQLPGEYRPVIANLTNNTQIIVLFEGSTWHKIQIANSSVVGWMKADEVTITTRGISALNMNSTISGAKATRSSDGWTAFRWGAGTEYDIMDNLYNGTYCWVFETVDGWSRVLLEDGRVGYINSNLLTGTTRLNVWPTGLKGYVQVSGDSANFRDGSSYSSNVIGQLYSGDIVDVLGEYNGFLNVSDKKGRIGYLSNDIISPEGLNCISVTAPLFYDNPSYYAGMTDVITYAASGTMVKVLATDGYVTRIQYGEIDGFLFDSNLAY